MANALLAVASTDVPAVDITKTPTSAGQPWGGFKLAQCDGPDMSNISPASPIKIDFQGKTYTLPTQYSAMQAAGYRPCNFNGLMIQVQFIINTMLVVGVIAALGGFSYAGYLYMTGSQGNLKKAHSIFPKVFWGFVIMLTGWFVVHQILVWLTPAGSAYLQ